MHLGTRSLTLTVDGVSRTADVSDCRIVTGPIDRGMRRLGGPDREYRLRGTAAQDPAEGSLWDLVWSNPGRRVEVDLRPAGGLSPSSDQPSFTGRVIVTESDGDLLGGEADPSRSNRFTFEIDWPFIDKPTRVAA